MANLRLSPAEFEKACHQKGTAFRLSHDVALVSAVNFGRVKREIASCGTFEEFLAAVAHTPAAGSLSAEVSGGESTDVSDSRGLEENDKQKQNELLTARRGSLGRTINFFILLWAYRDGMRNVKMLGRSYSCA